MFVGLLCAGVPALAQRSAGDLSATDDPRLARKVTFSARASTVGETLRGLSALSAVTLKTTGTSVDNQQIRVILRESPLSDALSQIAALFEWRWQRFVQNDEIGYRLIGNATTGKGDPDKVRRIVAEAVKDKAAEELEDLGPVLDLWIQYRGDLDAIKRAGLDVAQLLEKDPETAYRVRELVDMPASERLRWLEQRIAASVEKEGPEAKYALASRYVAAQLPTTDSDGTGTDDRTLTLKLSGPLPFWSVIEALSKQSGASFVSDRYSRRVRLGGVNLQDVTLGQVLDRICSEAVCSWHAGGGVIRLRSAVWFYDDLREPPKPVLARWLKVKKDRGKLSFADLANLAAALTDDQVAGLADADEGESEINLVREGRNILSGLNELRLYNMLTREQLRAAQSERGLPFLRMTVEQQNRFLRYTRPGLPLPEDLPLCALFIEARGETTVTFRYSYGPMFARSREVTVAVSAQPPSEAAPMPPPVPEEKVTEPAEAPKERDKEPPDSL